MVVLVFLANHCPVVAAYEDRIIDFANDYKGKSVKVVGVSVNDIDSDRLPGDQGARQGEGVELRLRLRRDPGRSARPTARPTPRSSSSSTRTA